MTSTNIHRSLHLSAATALIVLSLISGCATQKTASDVPSAASSQANAATAPSPETSGAHAQTMDNADVGKVVYFDYDRDDIKPEYRELIATHARYLRAHPDTAVKLGGHADERGTREYNLALSERRAKAVLNQMLLQGVAEAQLSTAAYGEEYPAATGHGEAAWSKNRRVEFSYRQHAAGTDNRP